MTRFFGILALGAFVAGRLAAQDGWSFVAQDLTKENLWGVAFGDRALVACGEHGTVLRYNYGDGAWQTATTGTGAWLVGVGYGNGRFVIVGDAGAILTSDDDGLTWTARNSGTTTRINNVAYGNSRWLAVGEQGAVLTSTDGTTWTQRPALTTGFLRALAFGQGRFVLGGGGGALYTTTDATTFTPVSLGTTANIEGAAISASRYWIVGSSGLWATATQPDAWTINPSVTSTTFRGVAARNADEAVAVAEIGAGVFRAGAWSAAAPPPPFLATAVVQGENEMVAVGFNGGLARSDLSSQVVITGTGPVEYGSNVQIALAPDNSNPPVTSWQWTTRADVPIPGATSRSLSISNITFANNDYRLHFTKANGETGYYGITVSLYPAGQPEVRDPGFVPAVSSAPSLVVPQSDGKLLVAGTSTTLTPGGPIPGLVRLNPDGSLDSSFNPGTGISTISSIFALHVMSDGRIYVRGSFTSFAGQSRPGLARLLPNGSLDPSFQPSASLTPPSFSALAADGRLYVQGPQTFATLSLGAFKQQATIARLALDGSADGGFSPIPQARLLGVDAQGRVVAIDCSSLTSAASTLVRYLPDGTRDPSYVTSAVNVYTTTGGNFDDFTTYLITSDGLYAETSSRPTPLSPTTHAFRKFLPNGGTDAGYNLPSLSLITVGSDYLNVAYRPDGGLWRVELAASVSGGTNFVANSFRPDGSRDTTRYATRRDQTDYQILAIASDGSLLVVGNRYSRPSNPTFMRLRPLTGTPGRLTNLSVRALVASSSDPLITGFVTAGTGTTRALVRGIGPGLQQFNVADAMRDPRLTLVRDGTTQDTNDNWDSSLAPRFTAVGAFPLSAGSLDAALESTIAAGSYSAVVSPAANDGGTALVELYESADNPPAPRRFINVSARGPVSPGHPLVAGFHVDGTMPAKVLIRAAGPVLGTAPFNLPGVLANPQLTLYRDSAALWDNDDWTSISADRSIATVASQVGAFAFASGSADSAMTITLAPGGYTAVVSGANNTSGTALVEVYEVP